MDLDCKVQCVDPDPVVMLIGGRAFAKPGRPSRRRSVVIPGAAAARGQRRGRAAPAESRGHGAPRDPRAGRPVDAEARARAQKPAADARPMLAAGVVDYADL